MTGWRGKQKGKISSKRERERERQEKKDRGGIKRVLWGPTKTGFIAARVKWAFYSWFPPTHREELPQDPLKPRRCASVRVFIHFLFSWLERSLGTTFSPQTSPRFCAPWQTHEGPGCVCVCVCWIPPRSVIFIALSYLLSQKSSRAAICFAISSWLTLCALFWLGLG